METLAGVHRVGPDVSVVIFPSNPIQGTQCLFLTSAYTRHVHNVHTKIQAKHM